MAAAAASTFPVGLDRIGKSVGFTKEEFDKIAVKEQTIDDNICNLAVLQACHSAPDTLRLEEFAYDGPGQPTSDIAAWKNEAITGKQDVRQRADAGMRRIRANGEAVHSEDQAPLTQGLITNREGRIAEVRKKTDALERVTDLKVKIADVVGDPEAKSWPVERQRAECERVRGKSIAERSQSVLDSEAALLDSSGWRGRSDTLLRDEELASQLRADRDRATEKKTRIGNRVKEAEGKQKDVKQKLSKCLKRKIELAEKEEKIRVDLVNVLEKVKELIVKFDDTRIEHLSHGALCQKLAQDDKDTDAEVSRAKAEEASANVACDEWAKETDACASEVEQCFRETAMSALTHVQPSAVESARNALTLQQQCDLAADEKDAELKSLNARLHNEELERDEMLLKATSDEAEESPEELEFQVQDKNEKISALQEKIAVAMQVMDDLKAAKSRAGEHFAKVQELEKFGPPLGEKSLRNQAFEDAKDSLGNFIRLFKVPGTARRVNFAAGSNATAHVGQLELTNQRMAEDDAVERAILESADPLPIRHGDGVRWQGDAEVPGAARRVSSAAGSGATADSSELALMNQRMAEMNRENEISLERIKAELAVYKQKVDRLEAERSERSETASPLGYEFPEWTMPHSRR